MGQVETPTCPISFDPSIAWSFGKSQKFLGSAFPNNMALNPKHEIRNSKRFDGLTVLSEVEGQYKMTKIQIT